MTTQLDLFSGGSNERQADGNEGASVGLDARGLTLLHALEAGLLPDRLPASRGGRLAVEWQPSEPQIAYARQSGCPDPAATAVNFREYWLAKAGAGARHVDWNLTWQTWCRRESEFSRKPQDGHRGPPGQTIVAEADPWPRRLKGYLPGRFWNQNWGPKPETWSAELQKERGYGSV